MSTYILQKDLPNVKADAEFIFDDTNTWMVKVEGGLYSYKGEGVRESISFATKYVENNPEWFKLKEETVYTVRFSVSPYNNILKKELCGYCNFININHEVEFSNIKFEAIKKAIEFILNDGDDTMDGKLKSTIGMEMFLPNQVHPPIK